MCTESKPSEDRISQIADIAASEPIGSPPFFLQVGILLIGCLAGTFILGLWLLLAWWALYTAFFVVEKLSAKKASELRADNRLELVLACLVLRVLTYDLLIVFLWTLDGAAYKLGATALLVGATVNSFVSQGKYVSTIACVAGPNALVFFVLAFLEFQNSGSSPEFWASLATSLCVMPYLITSILFTKKSRAKYDELKVEMAKTQRQKSMGQIAAGVAHDFNNIMSVVKGSLELSRNLETKSERDDLVRKAIAATDHASALTKQMLALGKHSPLIPKPTELESALREFVEFLGSVIPQNIAVELELKNTSVWLSIDNQMLQNALLNLALNAKAAMEKGGTITILGGQIDAPSGFPQQFIIDGQCAFITVTDTGRGIEPELLEHIFEPFFSTRDVGQGSGLGLPMVKGFVEQSGGRIRLESSLYKGTKATLFLPLSRTKPVQSMSVKYAAPLHASETKIMPNTQVVLVEDNEQLRGLLRIMLENSGYIVHDFSEGAAALKWLSAAEKIDILITDQVMPGEYQGTDLILHMKHHAPEVPIILMSGYADQDEEATRAFAMADVFLEKPLTLKELATHVSKLTAAVKSG